GGGSGNVSGPYGGITAAPPLVTIPSSKPAVSNGILFDLTLTGTLTEAELYDVAHTGMIEFGSDQRYLTAPEPLSLVMVALASLVLRRR
ncbi:MAG: hypothetical protein JXO22_10675, partial [Phycisphaerae bacterium]|nr:hypothetical protein [Phycisphaerae bacterium]